MNNTIQTGIQFGSNKQNIITIDFELVGDLTNNIKIYFFEGI